MLRPADRGALSPRHRTDPRSAGGRVRSDVGLLMAFWAFFSIFPLRFIFVTLRGAPTQLLRGPPVHRQRQSPGPSADGPVNGQVDVPAGGQIKVPTPRG